MKHPNNLAKKAKKRQRQCTKAREQKEKEKVFYLATTKVRDAIFILLKLFKPLTFPMRIMKQ